MSCNSGQLAPTFHMTVSFAPVQGHTKKAYSSLISDPCQGSSAPLDGRAAGTGDEAPSQGHAVNLIAAAAADVAQVKLRVAHSRPIATIFLDLSTLASVLCGIAWQ
jgi:hypothetical protein